MLLASRVSTQLAGEPLSPALALATVFAGLVGAAVLGSLGARLRPGGRRGSTGLRSSGTTGSSGTRRRSLPDLIDRLLGAVLGATMMLALAWLTGTAALGFGRSPEVLDAVEKSQVLRRLNADLPPARPVLDALTRVNPFPPVAGTPGDDSRPLPRIGRDPDVRASRASVVRVTGSACGRGMAGSGWVVARGLVVTNAHVVAGESNTRVQVGGTGPLLNAVPVSVDRHNDIAVLRVERLTAPALPLASAAGRNRAAAVLGFPRGGPYTVRAARIQGTRTVLVRGQSGPKFLRRTITIFTGVVRPGNSGGPLVDREGKVVATVFASRVDRKAKSGFAVPNDPVRQAIESAGEPVDPGPCAAVGGG